jgi:hypothetical protein
MAMKNATSGEFTSQSFPFGGRWNPTATRRTRNEPIHDHRAAGNEEVQKARVFSVRIDFLLQNKMLVAHG